MDAILMHPGKGTDNGGGSLPPLPAITFTGTYEYYYETYDDQLYAEIMMTSSGTLTGDGLTGDFWGIGGGAGGAAGSTYSAGGGGAGGSGYTFLVTGVSITGDVVIGAGGRGAMAHADGVRHPGIDGGTSSAGGVNGAGGIGGVNKLGGNGGSAGGDVKEAGGADGSSCTTGIGDGQIMAKFRNANKHNNPGSGGTSDTTTHTGGGGGAGYGGNGGSALPTSGSTGNGGSGYGSGGAGGSGASNNEAGAGGAGTSGIVFCRILL